MASYKLVVFSDSTEEGNEGEYNDWYTNQHLADVVDVPGFVSAQRFKIKTLVMGEFKNKYMAIYNIESDDPQKVMDAMMARRGNRPDGDQRGARQPIIAIARCSRRSRRKSWRRPTHRPATATQRTNRGWA